MNCFKVRLKMFFHSGLIVTALFLLCSNPSLAMPLTNTDVEYTSKTVTLYMDGSWGNWHTEYFLYSDEFGSLDAFCVENANVNSELSYHLIPVPNDTQFQLASVVASNYFYNNGESGEYEWSKTATQLAIWEIMFDTEQDLNLSDGNFMVYGFGTSGGYLLEAQRILNLLLADDPLRLFAGELSLARSPIGSGPGVPSQDYLVAATPVPEPASILLLGTGLIGIVQLGRKKIGGTKHI